MAQSAPTGGMSLEPIVEVSGTTETLMRFEVVNKWDGSLLIRSTWAIGTPVAYAPSETREERVEARDLRARPRLHELLEQICWSPGA